jgi:ATP-dependent Clp protease ATP-binding subunit ClpB
LGSQFLNIEEDEENFLENKKHADEKVMEAVRGHFKPEFLNRLDEIVIFNKLLRNDMEDIVRVQFARLAKRLLLKNIKINLSKEAQHYLATKGYDSSYGARPLKRLIQRELENILAEKILRGEIKEEQGIEVVVKDEALVFNII